MLTSMTTTAELTIDIPRRSTDPIPLTLRNPDGETETMTFTPPKRATMMLPLVEGADYNTATYVWLLEGLSEEDGNRIRARLADPADQLDWDTIGAITNALAVKVAGNRPPT